MSEPLRVVLVGARRRRQGLGAHLARFLVRHGAELVAIVGTSAESVGEARSSLRSLNAAPSGHTSLESALAAGPCDAIVIASPAETHGAFISGALAAGKHVLCEKPLLWGIPDGAREAARLEQAFREAGLVLFENCQWPYTLATFTALHGEPARPCREFEMWLSPTSSGGRMLVDALSHPLSLLQALAPGDEPRVEGVAFSTADPQAETLLVTFAYLSNADRVEVSVRLGTCPVQPRPAGYAIDGRRAERRVRMEDYALAFEDGGRRVPLPDPMEALVREFVAAARGSEPPGVAGATRGLGARQQMLETLVRAFETS